mmetsp:Transcript_52332/g.131445  ORF Transcript_52332/g.131445 Transcript_52332/m.131445 type:complete len:175 (-) Transcript_52332:106-630(-)|eukprot:CAMPEP_0177635412 /NCGR_PEP_ID=MMETSP0447-20121125/3888_1 /TAXON_ID=0 /ORGANISM="Stygamoeba regulata, Strain BSH-02190019" /LENGTH=174 /DNA_ID=CAMNT_0019137199 /DNA_START=67 /DNA_END=591 /DNA_ORIENTATION=-
MLRLCAVFVCLSLLVVAATCIPANPPPGPRNLHVKIPGAAGLPEFATAVVDTWTSTVYLSGTLGTLNDTAPPTLVAGGVQAETKQALENIKYFLEYLIGDASVDALATIVRCNVYLSDPSPKASKDMSEVYRQYFGTTNPPARMSFGGASLAFGASVEIECTAAPHKSQFFNTL